VEHSRLYFFFYPDLCPFLQWDLGNEREETETQRGSNVAKRERKNQLLSVEAPLSSLLASTPLPPTPHS
jgi:hypothetical protein